MQPKFKIYPGSLGLHLSHSGSLDLLGISSMKKNQHSTNYTFLLTLTSMNQDSRGHGGKTIEHPFYWVGSLPSPALSCSSLS